MMRRVWQLISVVALSYSVTIWCVYLIPWWNYLPKDRLLPVSGIGCGSAHGYRSLYEADPALRARILPVVLAEQRFRGSESETSAWSCSQIAQAMRTSTPVLEWVPRRFLCQSVRRHVVDAFEKEHHNLGPPLWVIDGEAVGSADLHRVLTREGIAYTNNGLEVTNPF